MAPAGSLVRACVVMAALLGCVSTVSHAQESTVPTGDYIYYEDDTCSIQEYRDIMDVERPLLEADEDECEALIRRLKQRQFGPPTPYEIFRVMCFGPCVNLYMRVVDTREAGNCQCGVDPGVPCYRVNTDILCKELQICEPEWDYWRHTCRGCGWEAANEVEWREDRAPDSDCFAMGTLLGRGRGGVLSMVGHFAGAALAAAAAAVAAANARQQLA